MTSTTVDGSNKHHSITADQDELVATLSELWRTTWVTSDLVQLADLHRTDEGGENEITSAGIAGLFDLAHEGTRKEQRPG